MSELWQPVDDEVLPETAPLDIPACGTGPRPALISIPTLRNPATLSGLNASISQFPRGLSVFHINAQSIKRHHSEIVHVLSEASAHVLLISETWLKSNASSDIISIPKYKLLRNDRNIIKVNFKEKSGGGVAMFVRDDIICKIIKTSTTNSPSLEYMFVDMMIGTKHLLVGVVYWPPNTGTLLELEESLSELTDKYQDIIIMGDFNCDLRNPVTKSATNFIHTFNSYNLQILKLNPTHSSSKTESWIDHLIVSDISKVLLYGQFPVPGISNHDLLFVVYSVKCTKYKNKTIHYRDYKNLDLAAFQVDSERAPWHEVYQQYSLDSKVNVFNGIITDILTSTLHGKLLVSRGLLLHGLQTN